MTARQEGAHPMTGNISEEVAPRVASPRWRTAAAAAARITAAARVAACAAWVLGTEMLAVVAARVLGLIPASQGFSAGNVRVLAACGLALLALALACSLISAIPVPGPAGRVAGSVPQQGRRSGAPEVILTFVCPDIPEEDQ